jgi:ketosteroid isomerase-like protein
MGFEKAKNVTTPSVILLLALGKAGHSSERENAMDDMYAINAAKTEVREGYNHADVDRILAVFADAFTDMSEKLPTFQSFAGPDAKIVLRARLLKLFREYKVELTPVAIEIKVAGDLAIEHGWHQMKFFPKVGGEPELRRSRYVEVWNRDPQLGWRIVLFVDNTDQEPAACGGCAARIGRCQFLILAGLRRNPLEKSLTKSFGQRIPVAVR